jgi:hypothetical protein
MTEMNQLSVIIQVGQSETADDELELVTRRLANELREAGLVQIKPVSAGPAPEGSKVIDPATLNALLLVLAPIMLTKCFELVQDWMQRREGRSATISIKVDERTSIDITVPVNTSREELARIINDTQQAIAKKSRPQR